MDRGASIRAHDPQGMTEAKAELPPGIHYATSIEEAIRGADAIVLLTEWNEYRSLDLTHTLQLMNGNVFVDLRNVYEPEPMRALGFQYHCVGRSSLPTSGKS